MMAHHFSHYYSRRCRWMVSILPAVISPSSCLLHIVLPCPTVMLSLRKHILIAYFVLFAMVIQLGFLRLGFFLCCEVLARICGIF